MVFALLSLGSYPIPLILGLSKDARDRCAGRLGLALARVLREARSSHD
jgi:hypothetical protein